MFSLFAEQCVRWLCLSSLSSPVNSIQPMSIWYKWFSLWKPKKGQGFKRKTRMIQTPLNQQPGILGSGSSWRTQGPLPQGWAHRVWVLWASTGHQPEESSRCSLILGGAGRPLANHSQPTEKWEDKRKMWFGSINAILITAICANCFPLGLNYLPCSIITITHYMTYMSDLLSFICLHVGWSPSCPEEVWLFSRLLMSLFITWKKKV